MFLEVAEHLRCPEDHPEEHLVVATGAMKGRAIFFGTIGCPTCRAEYTIVNGIATFGDAIPPTDALDTPVDPDAVQALLGLQSPGGYVALVGAAASLAGALASRMEGVHFIGVNPPDDLLPDATRSLVRCGTSVPLRTAMSRGAVLGPAYAVERWVVEATRVVLPGQRLVVLRDHVDTGVLEPLAEGSGMWVGKKP